MNEEKDIKPGFQPNGDFIFYTEVRRATKIEQLMSWIRWNVIYKILGRNNENN